MSGCLGRLCERVAWQALQATSLLAVLAHARMRAEVMAPAQFNCLHLADRRLSHVAHEPRHVLYGKAGGVRERTVADCLISEPTHAPPINRAAPGLQAEAVALRQPTPSSKEKCHAV